MSDQTDNPTPEDQVQKGEFPSRKDQFQPGQSGNPAGRKPAGATLREWINALADQDLSEDELRRIAKDKRTGWTKRAAANRILRTLELGDIADFAELVNGRKSIEQLRAEGVDTAVVKKLKPSEHGIEIELHDRAGEDFDRISDRTEGKPKQSVEMSGEMVQHVKRVTLNDKASKEQG